MFSRINEDVNKKEWLKKEVEELIQEYEHLPILWDMKMSDYHNRIKKTDAFLALARRFNTTKEEIVRKIHNLKNQYNSELKKEKLRDESYTSKWPYFQLLKFLRPTYEGGGIRSSSAIENLNPSINENVKAEISCDNSTNASQMERAESVKTPTVTIRKSSKRKRIQHVGNSNEIIYKKAVKTLFSEEDQYDIFGAYVASELRGLKEKNKLVRLLKKKIQLAIIEVNDMAD